MRFGIDECSRVITRVLLLQGSEHGINVSSCILTLMVVGEVAYGAISGDPVVEYFCFHTHARLLFWEPGAEVYPQTEQATVKVGHWRTEIGDQPHKRIVVLKLDMMGDVVTLKVLQDLSLIHISEPTRQPMISRMPSSA